MHFDYDITTGWGDHIDRSTWDALNTHDYSAISPTTDLLE
jgi:hypothetical protein